MRYEVRVYNLEESIPENRMTYSPCDGREDAKAKYLRSLSLYSDDNHTVELCEVNYAPWGESVRTIASSRNENPYHVMWDDEYLEPTDEEAQGDDDGDEDGYINGDPIEDMLLGC